jgi:hypothetical protein
MADFTRLLAISLFLGMDPGRSRRTISMARDGNGRLTTVAERATPLCRYTTRTAGAAWSTEVRGAAYG